MKQAVFAFILAAVALSTTAQTAPQPNAVKAAPRAEIVGTLPEHLGGTSSLLFLDNMLWTANDHGTLALHAIDTLNALPTAAVLTDLPIVDMEEIAHDSTYIYFGDIGDNLGTRTDLHLLRLHKESLRLGILQFDTIAFSYPDRDSAHARDFDCEAFAVVDTTICLFTKQWQSQQCACYTIPKRPGQWIAHRIATLNTSGMITGACYQPERNQMVLCGYNLLCKPFVYIIQGLNGLDFANAHQQRIGLANEIGTQTEAIATTNGRHFFLTNETLNQYGITRQAQLLRLDLGHYISNNSIVEPNSPTTDAPNATINAHLNGKRISIDNDQWATIEVYDSDGRRLPTRNTAHQKQTYKLSTGVYTIVATTANGLKKSQAVVVR